MVLRYLEFALFRISLLIMRFDKFFDKKIKILIFLMKSIYDFFQEEKRNQDEERIRMENILSGNPLLKEKYSGSGSEKTDMKVKRRWDDDVVFKNCSRAEPDKSEKTFINDSLRSDFHRKFMDKYIK